MNKLRTCCLGLLFLCHPTRYWTQLLLKIVHNLLPLYSIYTKLYRGDKYTCRCVYKDRVCNYKLTRLAGLAKLIPRASIPLIMAASDCIVLLYTTGRYCLHSSRVNPFS